MNIPLVPVMLGGDAGSRFWSLSREAFPALQALQDGEDPVLLLRPSDHVLCVASGFHHAMGPVPGFVQPARSAARAGQAASLVLESGRISMTVRQGANRHPRCASVPRTGSTSWRP